MKNERELKEMQIAYEVFSRCSTIKEALENSPFSHRKTMNLMKIIRDSTGKTFYNIFKRNKKGSYENKYQEIYDFLNKDKAILTNLSKITSIKNYIFKYQMIPLRCHVCGYDKFSSSDKRYPFLFEHINGDPFDFALHNLKLICYNCYHVFEKNHRLITNIRKKAVREEKMKLSSIKEEEGMDDYINDYFDL